LHGAVFRIIIKELRVGAGLILDEEVRSKNLSWDY
jgi:hypothetical protein